MAKRLASVTISALLLVGATRSWAGPGDIDANFGNGGRIELVNLGAVWEGLVSGTSLVLPDDRLVIGTAMIGEFRVARFDANGKVDPTFGDGGAELIPLPFEMFAFDASSAFHAPDGGLLFLGLLQQARSGLAFEAVLRLGRDGHPVTSFGDGGNGFYRVADAPLLSRGLPTVMAIAVDGNGRALLAKRSWTADGRCGGPTSVVRLTPSGTPDPAFGTNGRADVPGVDLCGGAALFGARNDGSIVVGARGAIVGLDTTGAPDWSFGVGGRVSHGLPNEWGRGVLLPDGGILIVEHDTSTTLSDAALTKFDRSGRLDSTFGTGTGSVRIDLGPVFNDISGPRYRVQDFLLTPDAVQAYLNLEVLHPDGSTACAGGIARVSLDGTPDLNFGRQGLTCLDYGAVSFSLIASQRNGSPLVWRYGMSGGGVYRLLVDTTASPGMITLVRRGTRLHVSEADGTATVAVVRTAGRDGAVSASFSTGPRWEGAFWPGGEDPPDCNATPGSDFHAASGRLDWADGDDVEREISVTILEDGVFERCDRFSIGISDPQGGALTLEDRYPDYQASVDVWIDDAPPRPTSTTSPSPTPPPASVSSAYSGGGGSLLWETLLVLSVLLFWRRLRPRRFH